MRTKTVEVKTATREITKSEDLRAGTFVEIKVNGVWRGIMLLGRRGEIVRGRYGGEWIDHGLFPREEEIEEMRVASWISRLRAEIPLIFFWFFPYFCLIAIPILILSQEWSGVVGQGLAVAMGIAGIGALLGGMEDGGRLNPPLFFLVCCAMGWAVFSLYACLTAV